MSEVACPILNSAAPMLLESDSEGDILREQQAPTMTPQNHMGSFSSCFPVTLVAIVKPTILEVVVMTSGSGGFRKVSSLEDQRDATVIPAIILRQRVRADFRERDEDSNFSIFRVRHFSEWPERFGTSSLNCLSCRNPYQTPSFTELPPLFTEKPFSSLKSASSHPLPKNRIRIEGQTRLC